MKLFKYIDEHVFDVLEKSRIKVTRISDLNDPFDSFPSYFTDVSEEALIRRFCSEEGWGEMVQRDPSVVERHGGLDGFKAFMRNRKDEILMTVKDIRIREEAFLRSINDYRNGAYLLSFSELSDDILMWSHYANHHKGAVIEFAVGAGPNFCNYLLKQVNYDVERPFVNPCGLNEELKEQFNKVFLTKSPHWSYEKEWRLLFPENLLKKDGELFFLEIAPSSIKSVILGCASSDSLRNKVISLKGEQSFKHIAFKRAVLHHKEYKIEIADLS